MFVWTAAKRQGIEQMADFACMAARDLRIVERASWDGSAASGRVLDWAGGGSEDAEPRRAARGFLAVDRAAWENRGAFKLPFCDLEDGALVAVDAGLRAAASRLPQTDIPEEVRRRARAVIDHYQRRMEMDDEGEGMMDDEGEESRATVYAFPMRVVTRARRGPSREELLARLEELAPDIVKLDRSLSGHAGQLSLARQVMMALVPELRRLGLRVFSQCIENAQQRRLATDLGVDGLQGHLIGRPAEHCQPIRRPRRRRAAA